MNFLQKCPKIFTELLSLDFLGQERSREIPAKFPAKIPCEKSINIHQRASAGAQAEEIKELKNTLRSSKNFPELSCDFLGISLGNFRKQEWKNTPNEMAPETATAFSSLVAPKRCNLQTASVCDLVAFAS